jgi:hypothetical protein
MIKKILFFIFISTTHMSVADVNYRGNDGIGFYISPEATFNVTPSSSGGDYYGYYCMVADKNGIATNYSINFNMISGMFLANQGNDNFNFTIYMYNYNNAQLSQGQDNTKIAMGLGDAEIICAGAKTNFALWVNVTKAVPTGIYAAGRYCSNRSVRMRSFFEGNRPRDIHNFDICIDWPGDPLPPEIQVKNLDDIMLGVYIGDPILPVEEDFCVYLNNSSSYNITFDDGTINGIFQLSDGTNNIPYTLNFKNNSGLSVPVAENSPISSVWYTNDNTCATTPLNVKVEVIPNNASISNSSAGTYTSILNITVSPE